ncbi:MAG: tRNA lysidine(34) synthetase TilS [Aquisalinus sp.]|nr:tRNA lysidine(34) synthetase TilS [Aquisalinus sp.]
MLEHTPVSPQEAEDLLRAFIQEQKKIAVAVSGGADSMALLWLLRQLEAGPEIVALTVDHGLRPDAADEAKAVASWCSEKKITHKTLVWHGKKPATGIQAQARRNRYRLLIDACQTEQIDTLLTAHNLDDQAETVFARLARASGPRGLAAMSDETRIAAGAGVPMTLARPLLGVPRGRLRATAKEAGLPFFDDPSNDDAAFERVRHRAFLAAVEAQDLLEKKMLVTLAAKMRTATALQEELLTSLQKKTGSYITGSGACCLDADRLHALSEPEKKLLLARLVHATGGQSFEPAEDVVDAALTAFETGDSATCGGALLKVVKSDLYVMREPSALLGRKDQPGVLRYEVQPDTRQVLWDDRLIVTLPETPPTATRLTLRPIGDNGRGPQLQRLMVSTLPALWQDDAIVAVPSYAKKILPPAQAPWNGGTTTLDISLLIKERLERQVVRF